MKKFALSFSVVAAIAMMFVVTAFAAGSDTGKGYPGQADTENRVFTGQKMHSDYQNNTNSCGSCHQLHSGSDSGMLTWATSGDFCASCHEGQVSSAPDTTGHTLNAGTFDTTDAKATMHEVELGTQLGTAPGGNLSAITGEWSTGLGCESCHAPHGNNNLAILRTNINIVDTNGKTTADTVALNLKLITNQTIKAYDKKPTTLGNKYIFVKKVLTAADVSASTPSNYTNYNTVVASSDVVYEPFMWTNTLDGYQRVTPKLTRTVTATQTSPVLTPVDGYTLHADGFLYKNSAGGDVIPAGITDASDAFGGQFASAEFVIKGYKNGDGVVENNSLWRVQDPNFKVGTGTAFSLFCQQCHTDYMSSSHNNLSGSYSTAAYRHNTLRDSLSCTRCHFSHGTDSEIMRDTDQQRVSDGAVLTDDVTAIKRYTGFSVCLQCHASAVGYKDGVKAPELGTNAVSAGAAF